MHDVYDVHNKLPHEIGELQPYHEKIYLIKLDEETQHHVYVHTLSKVFRFKNSLSYWVGYFNRCGCKFEKAHRYEAINLDKLIGYGWENATYGPWWVDLGLIHSTISKRCYNYLNKSEYRYLNKSIKLRKQPSFR